MGQTTSVLYSGEAEALQRACRREGCPVCTVVQEKVTLAMDTWRYEGFTDGKHREEIIRIRGFCPLHTWQLAGHNTAFQLALVYENILCALAEELTHEPITVPQGTASAHWVRKIKHLFMPGARVEPDSMRLYEQCPFCRVRGKTEQRLIEHLTALLHNDDMPSLLRQSIGLCRVHFVQAAQYAARHAPVQHAMLIACQQACVQRVLGEVRELIRKHDYRFSQEPRGEEMTSWRRAIVLCVGNPGVRSGTYETRGREQISWNRTESRAL